MLRLALLVVTLERTSACTGEWVDSDTPTSACTALSERDGAVLQLVMSDEFSLDGRSFADGHDSRWTAIEFAPNTNAQVNYYNTSLASTEDGNMVLRSTSQDVDLPLYENTSVPETRHLQTAMVQTWNKFCFTEGAAEIRAKLPGRGSQAGLWPAFWMMGNLGRVRS